ncbi:MAG: hypothetical protein J1G01_01360 [Clostridiales bacterium]|nr:hypothetical protein [Clostridiales bacterium]
MKKGLKALLATLLATSCCTSVIALSACGKKSGGKNPTLPTECTQHVDSDHDGYCDNCHEEYNDPQDDEYEISVSGDVNIELDISGSKKLEWTVYKNGTSVSGEKVNVSLNNSNVSYNETTQMLTGVHKGQTTVTLTLDRDESVKKTVRVTVRNYFFNHELNRGSWTSAYEDSEVGAKISITGGQAAIPVKEAATQFVFKYTLDMAPQDISNNTSFGIASFLPVNGAVGDNAMWFGLRGTANRGSFSMFVKQFYPGWGAAGGYEGVPDGYSNLATGFTNVEFVIIRNGLDYYCSIGGFYHKYTMSDASHADVATYAGIYGQELAFDVSNYTYSSDQSDVDAAIAQYYTNRGVSAIAIKETHQNEMVKGDSQVYTAAAYPTDRAAGVNLVWSVDKTEMSSGNATVTEAGGRATLTLSDDAAGYVTLICATEDGLVKQGLRIEILQKSLNDENDYVNTYGGVEIGGEGENYTLTFPESRMAKNGISLSGSGNEDVYQKTNYCAVFKTQPSKNYSIEFKFSQYKTNKNTPKLQVSLGADKNNFYLVYNNAGQFRIESYTQGTESNGFTTAGWHNTQWINNWNPNDEHTFKLTVSDRGVYNIYIDGTLRPFFAVDNQQQLANQTTIVRQYVNYDRALPVKIATEGCSVKLSEISITNGNKASSEHKFWSEHQSYTFDGETGFKMVTPIITNPDADGWQYGGWGDYKLYYTGVLDDGGYALDYDVTFGDMMTDAKFIMRVGSAENCGNASSGAYELQFTNKSSGVGLTLRRGGEWKDGTLKIDRTNPLKIKVRVELRGNKLRIIANGRIVFDETHPENKISDNSEIEFYMFNRTPEDVWSTNNSNKYAALANFNAEGRSFTAADVYELSATGSSTVLVNAEEAQALPVVIKHNGATIQENDTYTLAYALSGDDKDKFELSADGKVKGKSGVAAGSYDAVVTVSLKKGADVIDTMDFTLTFINKATSNNFIEVKGGVILDTTGDTDQNYTLTFPETMRGTNGVGNEYAYEDNAYSANFKQKVKGDFSIEFTVSNYKTTADFPKLMISLGGTNNQFYVVYGRQGGTHHVESYVRGASAKGHDAVGWISSESYAVEDFTTAVDTYKIVSLGGVYHVYRNGTELKFFFDSDTKDGNPSQVTLYRNYKDYYAECPVRISTNGVSAVVSNIKFVDLNESDVQMPKLYSYRYGDSVTNDGFVMSLPNGCYNNDSNHGDWHLRDGFYNMVYYTDPIDNDCAVEFDVEYSKPQMGDAKLILKTGNYEYHINNANGTLEMQHFPGNWGGKTNIPVLDGNAKYVHFRWERKGGKARVIANGKVLGLFDTNTANDLSFFSFGNAADANETVTVTNFTVEGTDYVPQTFYSITATESNVTVIPGGAAVEIGYTAYADNGTTSEVNKDALQAAGITVQYSITGSDKITLTENRISASADITDTETATVTISLVKDGKTLASATVGVTATARATENNVLTVSGGATLNYDSSPNEEGWSVTFGKNEDGVVDEQRYVEAGYSAKLKQSVIGDFELEFTVSNYVNTTDFPKLMISMGGTANQFYIVAKDGNYHIETFMTSITQTADLRGTPLSSTFRGGQWVSTSNSEFDMTGKTTFKIAVVNGYYKFYKHNGTSFEEITGFKMDNDSREILRNPVDYIHEVPVRISVKNCTATVSDVKLTGGTTKPDIDFYFTDRNGNNKVEDNYDLPFGGFNAPDPGQFADLMRSSCFIVPGQTAELTITYSGKMNDNIVGIFVDNDNDGWEGNLAVIQNKLKNGRFLVQRAWGDEKNITVSAGDGAFSITVKIRRVGNELYFDFVSGNDVTTWKQPNFNDGDAKRIFIYGFNNDGSEGDKVTISNFKIYDNA